MRFLCGKILFARAMAKFAGKRGKRAARQGEVEGDCRARLVWTWRGLVVLSALCISALFAHSMDESYHCVDDVLSLVMTSPEWGDCLDEANTNEVEVLFPTMASVFACEMPSNSCGFAWSAVEREQAFGAFLLSLSHTNRTLVTENYIRTGSYAFLCCRETVYACFSSPIRIGPPLGQVSRRRCADHETAWSQSGATDISNCQMLCKTHLLHTALFSRAD